MSACIRGHKRPMLNSHVGMEIRLSFYAMSALSRLHRVRRQCVNECTLCESTSSLPLRIKEIKNERALSLTLTFPFFLVHSVFTAPCNQHLCLFLARSHILHRVAGRYRCLHDRSLQYLSLLLVHVTMRYESKGGNNIQSHSVCQLGLTFFVSFLGSNCHRVYFY